MKSENWIDVNDNKLDADEYFKLLVNDFPMIQKEIEEEDSDMTHMREWNVLRITQLNNSSRTTKKN